MGAIVGNRVLALAVTEAGAAAPAVSDFTEFGGDERRGMIDFNAAVVPVIEERPGLTVDVENQRTPRKTGTVTVEAQDNTFTGGLFYGDLRGMDLHYRDMIEGKGAGLTLETGRARLETIDHAGSGSGFMNWSVAGQMPEAPVKSDQP